MEAAQAEEPPASVLLCTASPQPGRSPSPLSIPYLPEQRPDASCQTLRAGSFPRELITALEEREELGVRGRASRSEGAAQHLLPGRAMLLEPKFSLKNIPQNNDPPAEQRTPGGCWSTSGKAPRI